MCGDGLNFYRYMDFRVALDILVATLVTRELVLLDSSRRSVVQLVSKVKVDVDVAVSSAQTISWVLFVQVICSTNKAANLYQLYLMMVDS